MECLPTPDKYKPVKRYAKRYITAQQKHDVLLKQVEAKINRANAQLEQFRHRQRKLLKMKQARLKQLQDEEEQVYVKSPSWADKILRPIAKEMLKHLPGYKFEISGPFGIPANTHIWFKKEGVPESEEFNGYNTMYIGFRPLDLDNPEKTLGLIDYATNTGQYKTGTLGHDNDLNHPTKTLAPNATIIDLLMWMRNQTEALKRPGS